MIDKHMVCPIYIQKAIEHEGKRIEANKKMEYGLISYSPYGEKEFLGGAGGDFYVPLPAKNPDNKEGLRKRFLYKNGHGIVIANDIDEAREYVKSKIKYYSDDDKLKEIDPELIFTNVNYDEVN